MPKQISSKIVALTFGILAISFLAAFYVIAWQEPTQAPPGGNVAAPINVSDTGQIKTGNLVVNALGISATSGNALTINSGGNLCLGVDCRSSWPLAGFTVPIGGCSYDIWGGVVYCWTDRCWGKGYCPSQNSVCACTGSTKQIISYVPVSGSTIITVLCLKTF